MKYEDVKCDSRLLHKVVIVSLPRHMYTVQVLSIQGDVAEVSELTLQGQYINLETHKHI